jgi:hypothetical protein
MDGMNKAIVFAGPSIFGVKLDLYANIDFAPPAACGDVLKAVAHGYTKIGLIDGVFGSQRSVWHKELLYGLNQGVTIVGAASMGALRAAECSHFGMLGIGEIYEDFASGRRTADSDVAIQHLPKEFAYQPITVALVDADYAIDQLEHQQLLAKVLADNLRAVARNLGFRNRTWEEILSVHELSESKKQLLLESIFNLGPLQKTSDASRLLTMLSDIPIQEYRAFTFAHTSFFTQLMLEIRDA